MFNYETCKFTFSFVDGYRKRCDGRSLGASAEGALPPQSFNASSHSQWFPPQKGRIGNDMTAWMPENPKPTDKLRKEWLQVRSAKNVLFIYQRKSVSEVMVYEQVNSLISLMMNCFTCPSDPGLIRGSTGSCGVCICTHQTLLSYPVY